MQTDSDPFINIPEFKKNWRILNENAEEIISACLQDMSAGLSLEESIQICENEIICKQREFASSANLSYDDLKDHFARQLEHAHERLKSWE